MTLRKLLPVGIALLGLSLVACDSGRKRPPETDVRVLNVVPRYAALDFRRAESTVSTMAFKAGDSFTYDEDTYNFNVETTNFLTGGPDRLLSFPQKVVSGTTYTFVIYDAGATIDRAIIEAPTMPVNATDTQVAAVNVGKGLPAVDFYLTAPGADLLAVAPLGTLGFLQQVAPRKIAPGDYEVTVTAVGNPANVLLKSLAFTLPARASVSFVIAPEEGASNQLLSVVAFGDLSSPLFNINAPASMRVVNLSADEAPRDVAIDGQFSPPTFAAVPFAAPSAYEPVPTGATVKVNVTPAGNPGTLEIDATSVLSATVLYTMVVGGAPGSLSQQILIDDNRRFSQAGVVRFYDGVTQVPLLNFFIVSPGTENALPYTTLSAPNGSLQFPVVPGTYDLVIQNAETTTTVAGPIPITINAGGLYGVIATNNPNGVSVDVTLFEDLQ